MEFSLHNYMLRNNVSLHRLMHMALVNPRRACARVTVVVLCLSVYPSVPALAASASFETSKQRYSRVSLRLFLDLYVWSFEKTFRSKVMAWKSQYANELELTVSRFRAVSGPMKHSSYVKGNWWVECCFRGYNRRETSEIQARVYTGQRGTRTRMRSIYTACL